MTMNRARLLIVTGVLLVASFAGVRAEQRQGQKPAPTPTPDTPVETAEARTQREYENAYYRRPTFRLFQNYTLPAADVTREVFSVLADVQIDGTVRGDVGVIMGGATIGPTAVIEGSLLVVGSGAKVAKGARIRGDLVVIGGTLDAPVDFSAGREHVVIGTPFIGEWLRALTPWLTRGVLLGRLIVPDIGWNWMVVGILFFFGAFFNHVFARQVGACADTLARRPMGAFFVGLLVIVLAGPAMVIVSVTVIGLPFAIAAMLALNIFGKLAVTRAIGRGVASEGESSDRGRAFRSFVLGSAVLIVAFMIPVVGLLTWALMGVFGLGTATMTFLASMRKERPVAPPAAAPPPVPPVDPPVASGPPTPTGSPFMAPDPAPPAASGSMSFVDPPPPPAPEPAVETPVSEPMNPRPGGLVGYPRASFFDRIAAIVLDSVFVAIVNAWFVSGYFLYDFRPGPDNTFLVMLLAYHVAFWAWKGTTLGGIICNLRIVRTTGEDPRFIDALVRAFSAIFSVAALFIGCLWMLSDPEKQMWHDKFAGTVVVKLPRELVLA